MRPILTSLFVLASVASVSAIELKLDDSWLPKLGQLCDAARFGSRMTAEPICNDLGTLVNKAQQEEAAAKAKAAEPAKPTETPK
jgi:hypothetical protein